MFFNNGEALHGSPDNTVIEANVSHGCVRMRIQDAEWMRENFADIGTTVIVLPYN
jgi:lipoprotein-anchoring transpeptidase ErfK/SrfK